MKSYITPLACRVAALFTLMMIICPLSIGADEFLDEGGSKWYFTRENNVTKLHHYSGEVTENITTPAMVYYHGVGYPVTAIGKGVFLANMQDVVKNLTISEGVTSIEAMAFFSCTALVSASLPSSLRSIGASAFDDCSSLASIAIPDGVGVIPDAAFSNCTSLASVTIPASVTTIGNNAFSGCSALTSITIPNSVTTIDKYAFYKAGLTSVYFEGTFDKWIAVSKGDWSFECNGVIHNNYVEDTKFFHWLCTLTFDVQGHGTAPAPQTLWSNIDKTTQPADPEATGYTFGGWYWEPACTGDPVEFGYGLLDNFTIYAKWTPLPNTITFDLGGKGEAISDQTVYSGNRVSEPAVQFVGTAGSEEGIEGWYTDANLTEPYDFEAEVDHSFTLYAKWAEAGHYTLTANEGGTATLTDAKGRAYANGPIMPGTYTLTVAPQDGYSFTGSYTLINPGGSGDMGYSIAGSSTKTYTLDLTQKDADIAVTFTYSPNPILTIAARADDASVLDKVTWSVVNGLDANQTYSNGATIPYDNGTNQALPQNFGIRLNVDMGSLSYIGYAFTATITDMVTGTTYKTSNDGTSFLIVPKGSIDIDLYVYEKQAITLQDASDNSSTLAANVGIVASSVTLGGRTLYKDGNWNTLCLPFDVTDNYTGGITFPGTPLEGATVMQLQTTKKSGTGFADGTLTLNFRNATSISAGTAYIVKWTKPADYVGNESTYDITSPEFTNVAISNAAPKASTSYDQTVSFTGSYSPVSIAGEDRSILYLGNGNKLYWSSGAKSINSFRAYFQLNNNIAPSSAVRAFVLNFEGNEQTGITTTNYTNFSNSDNAWYTLDGRKLSGKPTTKGLYINKGKMIVIK